MSISLGNVGSYTDTYTSAGTLSGISIDSNVYLAEVLLIGGGGGSGGSKLLANTDYLGGGGGAGAYSIFFVPIDTTISSTFDCTVGDGGAGGTSTNAGSAGGKTSFTINGVEFSSNGGGGGANGTTGAGGSGGTSGTNSRVISINITGESGYSTGGALYYGSSGGGIGGSLGNLTGGYAYTGTAIDGTGGGASSITENGRKGASGIIQITWYIKTSAGYPASLNATRLQTYLFTTTGTSFYIPAPLAAYSARVLLIGGGAKGGNYSGSTGGSGGGQGVIANFGFPVPRGSAVQLIEVRTVSNNPWYVSPTATWEANAPATGNSVYWIYITSNANKTAPCGNYYVFYGNYNNTSYSSAYLSFNAELSASVIVNGTVVIAYASGPSGYSPSNPSIKLKPGNNSIVIYTYNNASSSSTTANYAGVWLALTTASAGGGTVIYKTDSTWTWSSVYGCIVGSGTGPSSSKFTLNTTHDFSTTATNGNQGICFIASPGSLGSAGSTSAVNSGTGYLLANNFAPSVSPTGTTPNSTNTSITTNGFTMFISGSTGAGASGGSGGAGGSFSGGTGGVTPTVGQTNGGGGGGGGGSTTNTGALGGDGLVMITFYCAPNQIDSPTPISLGNVATTTNIYNSGSGSSISVPSGAFMLQLYLLGGGGNGGPSNSSGYNGGGGGSGAIGVWFIPVNGLTTYSYTVGIPGTNTSFTINSKAFTANTGGNGGGGTNPIQGTAGVAGTIPTTPSNSVLMLKAIAGLDGSAPLSSSAGGDGAGLYGGDGAVGSTPPTSAGYGSGGGGGKSGVNSGIGSGGGNGLIVARWYFKYANISLTNYTSGPAFTIFPLPPYSNYVAGTYTATPPTGTLSFDVYIIGGQGGGGQGNFRNNPPPTNTISGGGGGGGGTSGYLLVKSIPYGGGTISLTVGAGGLGGTNAPPVYAGGLGGAGGTTSVTYNSTTYSCNGAPATRKGANWVTDGGVYNRGSDGGLGGLGNSTFSPSSGTGITTVSGETGNNGTAGVASPTSYQPPGGALTSFTITYSNGTAAKTFNSGAGNTGESAAGGGTPPNAFAGDAGGVYIIYNGA